MSAIGPGGGPSISGDLSLPDAEPLETAGGGESAAPTHVAASTPFARPVPPSGPPEPSEGASFDPTAMPSIRAGSGDRAAVRTLQTALNDWRAAQGLSPITVDGDFGPGTRGVVMAFQQARGLGADGVVGPKTWEALAAWSSSPRVSPERFDAVAPGATNAATNRIAQVWRSVPGQTSVTQMAGNGGRPVVVHLPPGFDPQKPARVVTMLHGHHWNVGARLESEGVLDRLKTLQTADPQTVFVFPEASSPPFGYWLQPPRESFRELHAQAIGTAARMAGAPRLTVDRRVVDAHSGAGLTLRTAIRSGELVADKVNLLDSAYGDWAQSVGRWASAQAHRPRIESWYTSHGSQAANNRELAALAPGLVTVHHVGSGDLHNAVPGRSFGTD